MEIDSLTDKFKSSFFYHALSERTKKHEKLKNTANKTPAANKQTKQHLKC